MIGSRLVGVALPLLQNWVSGEPNGGETRQLHCSYWPPRAPVDSTEEFAALGNASAEATGAASRWQLPSEPILFEGLALPSGLQNLGTREIEDLIGDSLWERRSTPRPTHQKVKVRDHLQEGRSAQSGQKSSSSSSLSSNPLYINGYLRDERLRRLFRSVPPMFTALRRTPMGVLGLPGQGMSMHTLPEPRFLQQVVGRSIFTLLSPEQIQHLLEKGQEGQDARGCSKQLRDARTACELRPGEAVYVPPRWGWSSCIVAGNSLQESSSSSADGQIVSAWGQDLSLAIGFGGYSIGWPQLFHSIADGDMKRLKSELQRNATAVHLGDPGTGGTAIELAVAVGDLRMVKLLHRHGGKHNDTGSFTRTYPLHHAAMQGHEDVVEWLLGERADVWRVDKKEKTALHNAAEAGHVGVAKLLLRARGNAHAAQSSFKLTPIHLAANHGHVAVLKAFRDAGADLSVADSKGCEPTMQAVYPNHIEVIEFLLGDEGLNPNAKCDKGQTAAHIAASSGRIQVLDALKNYKANFGLKDDDKHTPLHKAVPLGMTTVIDWFAAAGLRKMSPSQTPGLLHLAALSNQMDMAKLLLSYGANASAPEPIAGSLAIELAASQPMLELLLEALDGPVPNTSLLRAAAHGNIVYLKEIVKMQPKLLEVLRADNKEKEGDGYGAVHHAAQGGHAEVLSWLCGQQGLDCSARSSLKTHRRTPLHLAVAGESEMAKGARMEAVKYLLGQGCIPDTYDFNGMTPLELAGAVGHLPLVELLVKQHNADLAGLWRAKRDKYLKSDVDKWLAKHAKKGAYEKWLELGWPPAGPGSMPTRTDSSSSEQKQGGGPSMPRKSRRSKKSRQSPAVSKVDDADDNDEADGDSLEL